MSLKRVKHDFRQGNVCVVVRSLQRTATNSKIFDRGAYPLPFTKVNGHCIPPVYQFVVIYNPKFFPRPEFLFTFADH
jgi:hypothetical protein